MTRDIARVRILDCAEAELAKHGFAGARTKAIAQSAGYTTAMIHYYFATKEGLYQAVLDRMITELSDIVERLVPAQMDMNDKLEAFIDGYFDYLARHPNFARISKMSLGTNDFTPMETWMKKFFRPLFDAGVAFLEQGIEAGAFRRVDAEQYLVSFYCNTVSYFADADVLTLLLGRDVLASAELETRRAALKDLFFAGLAPAASVRPAHASTPT